MFQNYLRTESAPTRGGSMIQWHSSEASHGDKTSVYSSRIPLQVLDLAVSRAPSGPRLEALHLVGVRAEQVLHAVVGEEPVARQAPAQASGGGVRTGRCARFGGVLLS